MGGKRGFAAIWQLSFCSALITHIQEQLTPMGTHAEGLIGWSGAWKAYFMNDD